VWKEAVEERKGEGCVDDDVQLGASDGRTEIGWEGRTTGRMGLRRRCKS
jgi:hypothetical protein